MYTNSKCSCVLYVHICFIFMTYANPIRGKFMEIHVEKEKYLFLVSTLNHLSRILSCGAPYTTAYREGDEQPHRGGWDLADVSLLLHHLSGNIIFIASFLLEEKENCSCITLASMFNTRGLSTLNASSFAVSKEIMERSFAHCALVK